MSNLVHTATCRLCKQVFKGPEEELGGAMLLNEKPNTRVVKYIRKLVTHIGQKHPEALAVYQQQSGEYLGLLCLMVYETSDEAVAAERDYLRWALHKATRRVVVTDERTDQKAKELIDGCFHDGLFGGGTDTLIIQGRVAELLREMRDVFEERGRYKDRKPPETAPAAETPEPSAATS